MVDIAMDKDDIIKGFCISNDKDDLVNDNTFISFLDIDTLNLAGRYFVGVNVKVASDEKIKPVSCNNINYKTLTEDEVNEKIGGKIPDLMKIIPGTREITYKCTTTDNPYRLTIINSSLEFDNRPNNIEKCKEFLETKKYSNQKYTFVGHVIDKFIEIQSSKQFCVWIYLFDFDLRNNGEPLSYVLIITDTNNTLDTLKAKRQAMIDYIMLAKSHKLKKLTDQREREATKSAKAAIMSRNMSHNLGSHVMFYIKQRLQSVRKIVDTGALKDLIKADSFEELKNGILLEKTEMPFLVGLGRFINYLQERQDYIATIATDYIPYKSTINFKDAIYDELKPELRFLRHNDSTVKDTSMEGKQAANLLLKYIAFSEGFKESDRIELVFGKDFTGVGKPSDVPQDLRQFDIALPGGNLGRQAFFSIMENIIRNTAKHDGAHLPAGSKLKFRFDLLSDSDITELFAFTNEEIYPAEAIYDKYLKHSNDFHYLGITVDIDNVVEKTTMDKIRKGLNKKYLDEDGRMNEDCKGIKEIRISAAWMRGYGIDTDIPNSEPPAVAIRNNNNRLQYIICLPKPKKIAIVSDKSTQLDKNGIQFFSSERLRPEYYGHLSDFEMIVCSKEDAEKLRSSVGSRILVVGNTENDGDIAPIVNSDNIYMRWLHEKFGNNLQTLIINDDKSYNYKHFAESKPDDKYGYVDKDLLSEGLVKCDSADSDSDQIVYSKHYEGQDAIRQHYKNASFLEGISGGNSTDRLIRQERWTKEWYVKQMTTSLTRIAIFDERIHSSFVKQGENTTFSDWDIEKLKNWLTNIRDKEKESITSGVIQDNLNKEFNGIINFEDVGKEDDDLNFTLHTDSETLKKAIDKLHSAVSDIDYSTAALYAQKGVFTFDISSGNGYVTIKGYSATDNKDIDVAVIKMNKDSKKVECTALNTEFLKKKFHFIVIHQGILDKIYETLGIKDDKSIEKKKEVTSELFDNFSSVGKQNEDGFLPQFIIHSGRSRPNQKDMPQKQPFIQFAALDHAVRDCKYTLTELLYSAHYE